MGFIDKLKEQASSLGSQIDQALDGTKQKGQLGSLRKQRGEMVAQLGESLLEQFRQQQLDVEQLRPQADQIFNLEWQIIEAEKAIEAQKQAQAAAPAAPQAQAAAPAPPQAQAATPAPPAAPAPPQAPETSTGAATCASCGAEIPEGSAFCPGCGAKA
ncbi:MAG: zinc-ribbon domain-containing protein [Actinobacteria bacterium]|nr:zinc-ribbon domain-containing protein [Actinomycetota bacterium]